jgi:hypothetical protein
MTRRLRLLPLLLSLAITPALVACDDDDEDDETGLLASCDPAAETPCEDGLICVPDAEEAPRCHIAPGAACDLGQDPSGCTPGAECVGPTAPDAGGDGPLCLVADGGSCDPLEPFCQDGLTCAEVQGGEHRCHGRVLFSGTVSDALDASAIEGAHVIGIDDEGVAVTDVAVSDADGGYELEIPVVRDETGAPIDGTYTLRAAAADYQVFPGGLRTALPISLSQAAEIDGGWVVSGTLVDVVLIPLEDAQDRVTISGTVHPVTEVEEGRQPVAEEVSGVLVVATSGDTTLSALSDRGGHFTIFNATAGSYAVEGYAADVQLTPVSADVAGEPVQDVDLFPSSDALTTLGGNIQIVNAPGGAVTSVILVVESTFDADFVRGEVPRGLRAPRSGAPDVDGSFEITGVPNGTYVVLAAYENDDLVRDPDTNIAGTDFVQVTVGGGDVTLDESFKVTEALAVRAPGADEPTAVTEAPALSWADDSSEDWYEVRVFDAYGDEVWADENVVAGRGSDDVSVQYGGPMEVGMYYQFRVTSWRQPGNGQASPISATEDLRGVFYVQ